MNELEGFYNDMIAFKDQSVLVNFLDNHDNPRFLNLTSNSIAFKSYIAFTLSSIGIPVVYYGSEQGFTGGGNSSCREGLFEHQMDMQSPYYKFISLVLKYRSKMGFNNYSQIQRYSDPDFYAFTRGQTFMAFTNKWYKVQREIIYHPYPEGTVLCNIFWESDCITVKNSKFTVSLMDAETKILIPKENLIIQGSRK